MFILVREIATSYYNVHLKTESDIYDRYWFFASKRRYDVVFLTSIFPMT